MRKYAAALALSIFYLPAAQAADALIVSPPQVLPQTDDMSPGWALQVTPYLWATGMKGHISPFRRLPAVGIDKSFSDVIDNLDFGGFINVWGRYDRFVLSGDLMYVRTTDGKTISNLPPLPPPLPAIPSVSASVDSTQFMATLMGGYRLLDGDGFSLDALGGVRFWHVSNDVTVSAAGMTGSYGESFSWVDPVVGLRGFISLNDKLSLQAQADIGGFKTGSDLTWSVLATVNYAFNNRFAVSAGYKVLDVNYDRGGHVFDTRLNGPVLGLTYRF